ncbi:rhamnogalacturonan lyase [Bacillus solitudinis]|uniref:rhamnogalacturonan lyase n=1 Tax=Bacillus solitudinis TaxID=2014074 RepID=UPI000C246FA8|nr:rhamnogalacturonan lyase [Bacillus solitudinis]
MQLEYLNRGLVAVSTSEGVYLSWRLLASEVTGYSETGLVGTDFYVYRNNLLIATVKDSTNYLDDAGKATCKYSVAAVVNEQEMSRSDDVTPWEKGYYDIPLQKPADGVTPSGEVYTYSANDMSVGDVDGDGEYEFFVKWDPSNSKDVSQKGYTGNVFLDCYKLEGTLLYRIDLGVNIRAGAHYTQFMVFDFDGDGKAELMMKTAPGTRTLLFDKEGSMVTERFVTLPEKDRRAGYSHSDDYRMSSEDYYHYLVQTFMGWHQHEEVLNGHWPSSLEECFGIEKQYHYPLLLEDAKKLATYFIDVYAPNRSKKNDLRTFEGFILEGPEFLTVFEGSTGKELETIHYKPGRFDDGLMWGDYAMPRIEPGNRVDRFLAGVAYLDGEKPYAIFARGYYTRAVIISYSWDGHHLKEYWCTDSGWTSMSNPFNDNPHPRDGRSKDYGSITNQGAHSLSVADIDGDGKQEIIYGSATIDHDGSVLYSSTDVMPPESANPGKIAKLGHGDTLHVANVDPDRPGLEIFMIHENGRWAPYGYTLRDAATGEFIYGEYAEEDRDRGIVGDVNPTYRGLETWANGFGLKTAKGEQISMEAPGTNMTIRWSGDMMTQIVEGTFNDDTTITDWVRGTLLTANETRTNNGTKGNPCLVADIFGDWREELLVRTSDSSAIRIYVSTEVTDRKLYTLMHDAQYRTAIAWQNTVYNQPPYPSFYFASDIEWGKVPIPKFWTAQEKDS